MVVWRLVCVERVNLWWAERKRGQAGLEEVISLRQGRGGVSFTGAYF